MREVADGLVTGMLILIAYRDWKTKKISVMSLTILLVLVCIFQGFIIRENIWSVLGGILVGLFLVFVSMCTKEAIGYGDSLLITILGIYLGSTKILEIMLAAGFGASLFSVWRLVQSGWNRKIRIPFAPFLLAAYLGAVYL